MNLKQIARNLRHAQTEEEKELWRALRGRQFAGFKFRRQHTVGGHILDFYCAEAKLDVELDGFQHGLPGGIHRDDAREKFLVEQGIETLRFWNHQWQKNQEGCLLEIWNALQRRTGCVQIMNNAQEQNFVLPDLGKIKFGGKRTPRPDPLPVWRGEGNRLLSGSRPLPELFSAAGCQFEFSAKTIQPISKMLGEELRKL